jgi:hypothetical protein
VISRVVICCLLAIVAGVPASGQLVLNPGFETWSGSVTADNWTQYNSSGTVAPSKGSTFTGTVPVSSHGGAECQRVKLDAFNEQGGVYQRFSSTAGSQYTVSAWILTRLTSSGSVEAKLGVDPSGALVPGANTVWSTTVVDDSAWTPKSIMVTATGPYVTVFLDGRHPESSTAQCNVFFDDVSAGACTPPAAPTNAAATPSTIDCGQSSTLSASVSAGCTVDWYTGSCGGTLVGSGTSLAVSPMATTTYYPRTRNTSTGCVSLSCGSAVVLTVNIVPHALNRPSDPVVLTGANLPSFVGVAPGNLVAFRYSGGWQQVPVQVDERAVVDFSTVYNGYVAAGVTNLFYTDSNTYTGPDSNPNIDSNDEIVFMAADAGEQAPYFSHPAGVVSGTGIKVTIADPVDPGASAYVYLFRQNGTLSPGAGQQYVTYSFVLNSGDYKTTYKIDDGPNPENSTIATSHYKHHFLDRWKNDELRIYTGGATGVDILDRHKDLFTPDYCGRSEDSFCNGEGAFVVNKSGPVRALRSYIGANSGPLTQRDHICYARRQDIRTYLRVHQIPGIVDFFDYSPAASGMTYRNNNNTSGVTIDGNPETISQGPIHWELVDGPQGGLTIISNVTTNLPGISPTSYYLDDTTPPDTQCTGDAYAYGASGIWINQTIACTDPAQGCAGTLSANRVLYYDGPGRSVADAVTRHNWAENPVACVFSSWQDSTNPVVDSAAVTPAIVAAGDPVMVTVSASDDIGVASVTANGSSLTGGSGSTWSGSIPAAAEPGTHAVTVVATDGAGRSATDSTRSYETRLVVGLGGSAARGSIIGPAYTRYLFAAWGRVSRLSDSAFLLDDGSGNSVEVHAAGHGMSTGWFARARGVLSSGGPPVLDASPGQVIRLD